MIDYDELMRQSMSGGGAPSAGGIDYDALMADALKGGAPARPAPLKADPDAFKGAKLSFATPFGRINTPIPLPEDAARALAQLGSGFADWGVRGRQLLASDKPRGLGDLITGDSDAKRIEREIAEKRRTDAVLNSDLAGKTMNVIGKAAPLLAIPVGWSGRPILEGAAAGGVAGFSEPVGAGESATFNTLAGTAGGALLPAGVQGVRSALTPNAAGQSLAADAARFGVPAGIADVSSNPLVRGFRSFANDLPVVGSIGANQKAAQQTALNRAVNAQMGATGDAVTAQGVQAAKTARGNEMQQIWNSNDVVVSPDLFQTMARLRQEAANLPQGESARLNNWINEFMGRVQPGQNGQAIIPGSEAYALQSTLRRQAESAQGFLKNHLNDLRQSVIGAFNQSVTGPEAQALTLARTQYKNAKTIEDAIKKAEVGTAGRIDGDVPAALLPEAVRSSYANLTTGPGEEMAALARVASRVVADRAAQTGGSPRAMLQNMGIGSMLTGGGYLGAGIPGAAATVGSLGLLNAALGSPAVLRAFNNPPVLPSGLIGASSALPAMTLPMMLQAPALP